MAIASTRARAKEHILLEAVSTALAGNHFVLERHRV